MTVGVAKVEARAAARPFHLAFDRDAVRLQAFSPSLQLGRGDGEREVKPPTAVVRRDRAPGKNGRRRSGAFAKQQQDLAAWHVQRPKRPLCDLVSRCRPNERSEPKNALIEFAGTVHVIDIESRFQ